MEPCVQEAKNFEWEDCGRLWKSHVKITSKAPHKHWHSKEAALSCKVVTQMTHGCLIDLLDHHWDKHTCTWTHTHAQSPENTTTTSRGPWNPNEERMVYFPKIKTLVSSITGSNYTIYLGVGLRKVKKFIFNTFIFYINILYFILYIYIMFYILYVWFT